MLTQVFREDMFPAETREEPWGLFDVDFPCMDWPLTVGSLDWVARCLSEMLMGYVNQGIGAPPKRAFFVTNTQDVRRDGSHWISMGITLR